MWRRPPRRALWRWPQATELAMACLRDRGRFSVLRSCRWHRNHVRRDVHVSRLPLNNVLEALLAIRPSSVVAPLVSTWKGVERPLFYKISPHCAARPGAVTEDRGRDGLLLREMPGLADEDALVVSHFHRAPIRFRFAVRHRDAQGVRPCGMLARTRGLLRRFSPWCSD